MDWYGCGCADWGGLKREENCALRWLLLGGEDADMFENLQTLFWGVREKY